MEWNVNDIWRPLGKIACLLLALIAWFAVCKWRTPEADFPEIYKTTQNWVIGLFVLLVVGLTLYYS